MKSGAIAYAAASSTTTAQQQQSALVRSSDADSHATMSSTLARGGLASLLAAAPNGGGGSAGAGGTGKPAKFVISRPIRGIMLNPLQVKVLVPRAGRSVEYQLSKASPDPTGSRPQPGSEDPAMAQALKAAQEALYVSIQAQRATDEGCNASMSQHTHFDLVLRLLTNCLCSAHLLCKVVYQNVRGELKEMGPYLMHATDQVTSYRLEEMNCKLSAKTGHHHVYLLLQLVSAEAAAARTSGRAEEPPHLPSHAQLPDFSVQWSPLATLRLVGDSQAEDPRPVYCVPQLLALCSGEIRSLLLTGTRGQQASQAKEAGELVLQGAAHADLLLLVRLTYPGTTWAVTASNVTHVLRLAARFQVPHLLATADRLLCGCVRGAGPARRAELGGLAGQYGLPELAEALRAADGSANKAKGL